MIKMGLEAKGPKNACSDAPHSLDDPQDKRFIRVTRVSLEIRRVQVPALRRGQGPAVVSRLQAPRNTRYLQGAPLVPIRDLVATPAPPPEVLMVSRGPVEPATCPVDLRGHLVREVLIARIQGPLAQEVPQDLIGHGTAHEARVRQEHHVDLRFPVELEDPEDEVPQAEGLIVALGLEDPPVVREALLDEAQVVPLEVLEGRVLRVLQPPQGREVTVDMCRLFRNFRAHHAWPDGLRCIGPPVRGTRRPRNSKRFWTSRWWRRGRRPVRIRRCRERRRRRGIATAPTSVILLRTRHCSRCTERATGPKLGRFSRNQKDLQSTNSYGQACINNQHHG